MKGAADGSMMRAVHAGLMGAADGLMKRAVNAGSMKGAADGSNGSYWQLNEESC